MEALSGAASGIAVVSLSIQLIECVGSIKTFIRNVKDAQKELERLVDLLERLEALLEDVRGLMEQQASLEHFPTPSATIFKCLKSCEKTLEPLQATVDKYTPSKSKTSTSMDRLKNGLRMGFKTKDIQDFETRIEREVNFLQASLGANCGAILIQLGPALLRNRSSPETINQSSTELINPIVEPVDVLSRESDTMSSNARAMRPSVSIIPVRSPLEKLGIYQRKVVRRVPCTSEKVATSFEDGDGAIVSETHETTLLWSILGHGFSWIQRRSFGRGIRSLSTFPVVQSFGYEINKVFIYGEMQDFLNLLHHNVIHPFLHDVKGRSLLHVAARFGRADIYLLLRQLGLKQNVSINGESPLETTLLYAFPWRSADLTRIYRNALEDPELSYNPVANDLHTVFLVWCHIDSALWLYRQIVNILPYEESCALQALIVWDIWRKMCWTLDLALPDVEYPSFDLNVEILNILRQGKTALLLRMFDHCQNSYDSFVLGNKLLEWISNSGIDVEQFIGHEVKLANVSDESIGPFKRFIFEARKEGGWRLGFEYEFDRKASGYLLVSEYETLIVSKSWDPEWLIYDTWHIRDEGFEERKAIRKIRSQRRMAARARKQSGQKWQKSRMPGAWVY